mgnify:CR=1 FL=1
MGGGGNAFWPIKNLVGFISYLDVFCFFSMNILLRKKITNFLQRKGVKVASWVFFFFLISWVFFSSYSLSSFAPLLPI